MDLGQLIAHLRGPILNDRSARIGGASDYMWSDEELTTFINEAQQRFASRSLILRDGTTDEVTKVTLVPGQAEYPLHPSVLAVLSAKHADNHADLTRVGHAALSGYAPPTQNWTDPVAYQHLPAGRPLAFLTDETLGDEESTAFEQVTLRVYPTPDADTLGTSVRLRVVRMPLDEFRAENPSQQCEIPRQFQIQMLDWAAYLALRVVDDDAGSPARAREFAASFEDHVKSARTMVMRKLFAPTGWGFGRNGFAWGR